MTIECHSRNCSVNRTMHVAPIWSVMVAVNSALSIAGQKTTVLRRPCSVSANRNPTVVILIDDQRRTCHTGLVRSQIENKAFCDVVDPQPPFLRYYGLFDSCSRIDVIDDRSQFGEDRSCQSGGCGAMTDDGLLVFLLPEIL